MCKPRQIILTVLFLLEISVLLNPISVKAEINSEKLLFFEKRLESLPSPIQASIMAGLANYYFNIDRHKSVEYAKKILETFPSDKGNTYKQAYVIAYHTLATNYSIENDYTNSLDYYFKAEDYIQKGYNEELLSSVMNGIGKIYLVNSDLENASKYLLSCYYLIKDQTSKKELTISCLENLSILNIEKHEYDSALVYADLFLKYTSQSNPSKICRGYFLKTRIYNELCDYSKAIFYGNKGLKHSSLSLDKTSAFRLNLTLAYTYILMNNIEQSLYYFRQAQTLISSIDDLEFNADYNYIGGRLNEIKADYKSSTYYYTEYIKTREKIYRHTNEILKTNIQKQYFIHQQNKQISDLKQTNIVKDENLRKNQIFLYSLTGLAALLVITFTIIFFMQRDKYRNRRIISAQRAELTKKQYLEELQDAELKAAQAHIEGQERERERLAKDLHDGIGGTLAGIKMELESHMVQFGGNKQLVRISDLILSTYKEVRSISHNFAIPDLMKGDYKENLKNMIHNIPGKNKLHVQLNIFQKIKWELVESNIKIELYRIIQESVTNIIKHANATNAEIQIIEDDGYLNITIEDDGKGFNTNAMKHGLGLRNLKSRVDVLKGKFEIDSSPGSGTFLYFNIPLIPK